MRFSRANSTFWLVWLCAVLWCYINSFDDPSSIFFNPRRAFYRSYSATREAEAASFLEALTGKPHISTTTQENELLCVGVPSVNRTRSEPLVHTLATLVDSLTAEERDSVHFVVLLADKDPRTHVAYGAPWLTRLADDVVVYDTPKERDTPDRDEPDDAYRMIPYDIRRKGRGRTRAETTHLDHSVLIETCRKRGSPYFALIQDDVVASRDWFKRLRAALPEVEDRAKEAGRDWLYVRLFYSELLMGWNSEEIPDYLRPVAFLYAGLALIFLAAWCLRRRSHRWHAKLPINPPTPQNFSYVSALVLCLWTPAIVALVFVAGRVTLHRLITRPQVREMPRYGCCAQGLVFPSRHLEGLQTLLREPPYRFPADMVIDTFGDEHGLSKWALDPSVLQHVGMSESSNRGKRVEVWNFSFERMN